MTTEPPKTVDPAVITTLALGCMQSEIILSFVANLILWITITIIIIIIIKSFYTFAVSNPGMRLPKYRYKLKPYVDFNGRHLALIKVLERRMLDCAHAEHQRGNRTISNQVYKHIWRILFNEQATCAIQLRSCYAAWWWTAFNDQNSSVSVFYNSATCFGCWFNEEREEEYYALLKWRLECLQWLSACDGKRKRQ